MKNRTKFRSFLFTIIALMMGLPHLIYSQNTISIGPRLGINLANVSNVDESSTLVGLVLGVTGTYSINETSGITLDVLYSQEGYKEPAGEKLSLNYLQVPLYFNVFFGDLGESFRPKIYAGVSLGYLMSAEAGEIDIKDNVNSLAFSLTGGLGFNYRLSNKVWLNTDVRSFWGLTDTRGDEFQTGDSIKARNLQFSLGVAFGL